MRGIWKVKSALVLTGILLLGSSFVVCAEEKAGYHVYEVQENEATDTWYGIARGDYLQTGIGKLTEASTGVALCTGTTLARMDCDRVYVGIFLDQSDNGLNDWGTIAYWTNEAFGVSKVSVNSGNYKVARDKYYRVKGGHSAEKSGKVEETTTCTDALYFD